MKNTTQIYGEYPSERICKDDYYYELMIEKYFIERELKGGEIEDEV